MPTYKGGITTVAATNGAAYCTLHTSATRRAFLRELHIFTQSAVQSSVSLGIPGNTPVATTSVIVPPIDAQDAACLSSMDTVWSSPPTIPATFFEKVTLGASAGQGVIIPFTPLLILPKSTWLVLWNHGAAAGSALEVTWVIDE